MYMPAGKALISIVDCRLLIVDWRMHCPIIVYICACFITALVVVIFISLVAGLGEISMVDG